MTIVLPHPPKACSPNSRAHWRVKARGVKALREWAGYAAFAASGGARPKWKRATVQIRAFYKEQRRRDADNIVASCKSLFDGLQDAGIIENDSGLVHLPPVILVDARNPRVEIVIEPLTEQSLANPLAE